MRVGATARRGGRLTLTAIGWLALLVALDAALGLAWGAIWDSSDRYRAVTSPSGGSVRIEEDDRVDSPALADSPWREEYFHDFARLRYDYVPFLFPRVAETHTRYINSIDGVRRSYQPVTATDVPEVWFFGGSTTWGEGQRDLHTIPSEVARVAEAAGTPVRVVNFGERGYVSWQELQLFERALAHRPAPALAVFYDGLNEFGVQQQEEASDDPIHFQTDQGVAAVPRLGIEWGLNGALRPTGSEPTVRATASQSLRALWARYRSTSLLGRASDGIAGLLSTEPAGAAVAADAAGTAGPQPDVSARVAEVYRRSQALIRHLARRAGTRAVFAWQPYESPPPEYFDVVDRLDPPVLDLTHVLDGHRQDGTVYLDGGHTNELGAHLVAEALWDAIAPTVVAPDPTNQ